MSAEDFIQESFSYLKLINPELRDEDRIAVQVGKLSHAQPICTPRFLEQLPPVDTGVHGLQIADTSCYYPEDRGISESARYASMMAERVM